MNSEKKNGTANGDDENGNGIRLDLRSEGIEARFRIRQSFLDGMKVWGPKLARWITWIGIIIGIISAVLGAEIQ